LPPITDGQAILQAIQEVGVRLDALDSMEAAHDTT
jgi:hypothetical protein